MLKKDSTLLKNRPLNVYSLYDEYAGMLLGYIIGVVKNQAIAEDYLVKTFNSLAKNFNEINWEEASKWCHLQRLAKNELLAYHETANKNEIHTAANGNLHNKYLNKMSEEQRIVFSYFYFHKKTVEQLSQEIDRPEDVVRKLLKEAFVIIRGVA